MVVGTAGEDLTVGSGRLRILATCSSIGPVVAGRQQRAMQRLKHNSCRSLYVPMPDATPIRAVAMGQPSANHGTGVGTSGDAAVRPAAKCICVQFTAQTLQIC